MSKRFSEPFKQEAVQLVSAERPLGEVASQLGIGYSTLDKWVRAHRRRTGQLAALTQEQKRIRELDAADRSFAGGQRSPKKGDRVLCHPGKSVRYTFMQANRGQFSMRALCTTMKVSRSGDDAWCARDKSPCPLNRAIARQFEQDKARAGAP